MNRNFNSSDTYLKNNIGSQVEVRLSNGAVNQGKLLDINEISFSKLRDFESINYASIILPNQKNIDLILTTINELEEFTIKKLIIKSSLDESDIFNIVTLLLKYGYIKIVD